MTERAMPQILLGALMLMLMCVVSGRPQPFADTKSYYALGHEIVGTLAGTPPAESQLVLRGHVTPPAQAAAETRLAYTVAATRSPAWSTLLYLLCAAGTAWLYVAVQALIASATLLAAARAFDVSRAFLPIVALLAVASTLPVFVLFIMPDVFLGLAVVAAAALLFRRERLGRGTQAGLLALLTAAALFHTSNILVLGVLGAGGLLWTAARPGWRALRPGATAVLGAAVLGAAGGILYPAAVLAVRHQPIYAPPFLTMRLIADGPGRAVLRQDCRAGDRWGLCRFTGGPLDDVNQMLWDDRPRHAVFQAADYDLRVRIIGEQSAFVLQTLRRYPLAVAEGALSNVSHLFAQYGVREVLNDPTPRYRSPAFAVFTRIVPDTEACRLGIKSCASRLSIPLLDSIIGVAMLGSLLVVLALLASDAGMRARWCPLALFLLAALAINAAVCGILSGDAERYQARVAWLVPTLALFMLADRRLGALRRT